MRPAMEFFKLPTNVCRVGSHRIGYQSWALSLTFVPCLQRQPMP